MLRELLGRFRVAMGSVAFSLALSSLLLATDDPPSQTVQPTDAKPTTGTIATIPEGDSPETLPSPVPAQCARDEPVLPVSSTTDQHLVRIETCSGVHRRAAEVSERSLVLRVPRHRFRRTGRLCRRHGEGSIDGWLRSLSWAREWAC